MGNEMGNNNTSGLKEEDFPAVEASKEYLKEASSADVPPKEENHLEPAAEGKVFQEKVGCLIPDDTEVVEDLCFNTENSSKKVEQEEEREVVVDDSTKDTVGSTEADSKDSVNQPISFSSDAEQEPHMDQESLPNISSHQLEKQASVRKVRRGVVYVSKEEKEMINSNVDPMPLSLISELQHPKYSKPNQHELGVIHVEPSVRNGRRSSWNSQDGTRSSLICPTERNDHLLETEVMEDSEDYISTNTSLVTEKKMNLLDEQKASQEERRFHEDAGDITETGLSNITTIPSNNMAGLGEKTDIGFPMDNSLIKPESMEISPKPHLKVPEIQPKCMDLKKYSRNFEKDLESGMLNHDYNSDQSCEELMKETKPSKLHASRYESKRLGSALESNDEKHDADPCACFESSEDFVTKEATVAENGDLVVGATNKQNGFQEEYSKFIEVNAATNLELGTIRAALNVEDSNHKENKSTKKQIVEEEQQIDPLFADENERGGEETTKKQSLPVGPAEALPPQSSSPLPQSEYGKQESALSSETVQSNHQSVTDLKQNTYGKPTYIMDSSSKHTNMKADCIVIAQLRAAETKVFEKQSNEQCAKDETSSFLRRGSAANEYVERFSTDSDSSNLNVHGEMRKSPSFNLDLRIEARTEEPDGTPLLYQENSTLQSLPCQPDVSRGNPTTQNGYDQEVPLEEKIVKLERIDSEKLKTPFLGFLREEEEVNTVVKPHKQDIHSEIERKPKDLNKSPDETTTTSAKGKQKRRTRSSLFGTCMCCATV